MLNNMKLRANEINGIVMSNYRLADNGITMTICCALNNEFRFNDVNKYIPASSYRF